MTKVPLPPVIRSTRSCVARVRRHRQGFTLAETIVAVLIVALVMAGLYQSVIASMKLLETTRNHYVASSITDARLERARTTRYADLALLAENNTLVDQYGLPTSTGTFRRTTAIATNGQPAGCTLVTVTTEVQNRQTGSYDMSSSMNTIMSDYDLPP